MVYGFISNALSGLGLRQPNAEAKPPPSSYVLVPPLFERVDKDRDRFVHSSYEYILAKQQLNRLFKDYLNEGYQGVLLLSPPAEQRVSVHAVVATGDASMSLRFQPTPASHTFLDIKAAPQGVEKASLRCSVFNPQLGAGVFVTAPLARSAGSAAKVGLRYSSPSFGAGVIAAPKYTALSSLWAVGRHEGCVGGLQLRLDGLTPGALQGSGPGSMEALRSRLSVALGYEPSFTNLRGSGRFSASVELQEGSNLTVSFFQHLAQVRRHINPLEDRNVVGITNHIDIGISINMDITPQPVTTGEQAASAPQGKAQGAIPATDSAGSINIAAAWQVNKNWLVKARVGDQSASASVAVKSWSQTGLVASASVTCRYTDPFQPRYGATLQLENFGEPRYERGTTAVSGRSVLQRHEATDQDVANALGTGRVVLQEAEVEAYNTPLKDNTTDYL